MIINRKNESVFGSSELNKKTIQCTYSSVRNRHFSCKKELRNSIGKNEEIVRFVSKGNIDNEKRIVISVDFIFTLRLKSYLLNNNERNDCIRRSANRANRSMIFNWMKLMSIFFFFLLTWRISIKSSQREKTLQVFVEFIQWLAELLVENESTMSDPI